MTDNRFYLKFGRASRKAPYDSFFVSPDLDSAKAWRAKPKGLAKAKSNSFENTHQNIVARMNRLRASVNVLVDISHLYPQVYMQGTVAEARKEGDIISDTDKYLLVGLPESEYPKHLKTLEKYGEFTDSIEPIKRIFLLGLISVYDDFLQRILKCVYVSRPEILSSSDKQLSYADLSRMSSIEDARSSLIEKELESFGRKSHQEQIDHLEKLLEIPFHKFDNYPKFIEICERRNLIAHTGGVVNNKYVNNLRRFGYKPIRHKAGETIQVDSEYLFFAFDIIEEVAIKLCQVCWRKVAPNEAAKADDALNERSYDLIVDKRYSLAAILLKTMVDEEIPCKPSDRTYRMALVNLANAVKLGKLKDDVNKILGKVDWSAVDPIFSLCVAAVKDDIETSIEIMNRLPESDFERRNFSTWPVFTTVIKNEKFRDAYKSKYGEVLVKAQSSHKSS